METQKPLEKRIHNKLLAVRRYLSVRKCEGGKRGKRFHSEPWKLFSGPVEAEYFRAMNGVSELASQVAFNLALEAEKGNLTQEQYKHFDTETRAGLICELARDARDLLNQNRETYGVDISKLPVSDTKTMFSPFGDEGRNLERNVYRLTREQLSNRHGIRDWSAVGSWTPNDKIPTQDIIYGRFLKENGLLEGGAEYMTEESADVPSFLLQEKRKL